MADKAPHPKGYLDYDEITKTGVFKALEQAGSITLLAEALGVTRQAAYVWIRQGGVPLKRAIQIEKLYGISRIQTMGPHVKNMLTSDVTPTFKRRLIGGG